MTAAGRLTVSEGPEGMSGKSDVSGCGDGARGSFGLFSSVITSKHGVTYVKLSRRLVPIMREFWGVLSLASGHVAVTCW